LNGCAAATELKAPMSDSFGPKWLTAFMLAALLAFYCFLSTKGSFEFREAQYLMNYDMLAEAFLSGQLHLKQEMDPDRAKSPDPSDPELPFHGLTDAIAFKGKYYLLQQPLPAVFHALWIVLTGLSAPTGVGVTITATGCLLLLGLILLKVRDEFFPDSSAWILWYTWLSFALSAEQLYMIGRPIIYHETISFGVMFVLLGTLLFIHALTRTRNQTALLTLSGASFGAAVACKATLLLYPLSFFTCWSFYTLTTTGQIKSFTSRAVSFLFPVVVFVTILLAYNYLRFGSLFDFGRQYSIVAQPGLYEYCCIKGHYFRVEHLPYNLFNYFCALPTIHQGANFTSLSFGGVHDIAVGDVVVGRQDLISLPLMMPVLLMVLLTPLLAKLASRSLDLRTIVACCITSSVAVFGLIACYHWAAARYVYEFTPLLFVVVYCVLISLWETVRRNDGLRRFTVAGLGLIFCANIMMGLVAGVIGFMYPR
jgi:hypothetical protein